MTFAASTAANQAGRGRSAWTASLPNGDQPHEELQRSLRVRHAATTGDEGVDLLSWQAEHPAQIDLLTVAPELRPQLGAKLIPKRRLLPWPQGAATAAWATRFETIGF